MPPKGLALDRRYIEEGECSQDNEQGTKATLNCRQHDMCVAHGTVGQEGQQLRTPAKHIMLCVGFDELLIFNLIEAVSNQFKVRIRCVFIALCCRSSLMCGLSLPKDTDIAGRS